MKSVHVIALVLLTFSSCSYGKVVELNFKTIEESLGYEELEKPELNLSKFKD